MNDSRQTPPYAVPFGAIAAACVALAAAWAFDLTVLKTPVLTYFVSDGKRIPAATPIYAFWLPALRPQALLFVAGAWMLATCAPRLCDPQRTQRRRFALALAAAAIALPLALFVVRQPLSELGALLSIYRDEELLADAQKIRAYAPFLRHYVELMPQLSLHGKHFPPGHASWLYALIQLFGPSTIPVAIVTLLVFAAGVLLWYCAFRRLGGERSARVGALLLLACPSLLDFACTSMDAVLFGAAGLCVWLATRAAAELTDPFGSGTGRLVTRTAATGAALFLATCLSFSALPLGLLIGLYLLLSARRRLPRASLAIVTLGASYVAGGVLLWSASGFSIAACLARALELNKSFMSHVVGRDVHELYGYLVFGNAAGFAIGAGVALVAAAGTRLARGDGAWTSFAIASVLTLGLMTLGGIYFMETERIWVYAMPWLAGLAVAAGAPDDRSLRALLGVGAAQAFAMEVALFTLW